MQRSPRRVFNAAGVVYGLAILILTAVNVVAPQRAGLLALSQIVAPLLFLPLLLWLPLAVGRLDRGARFDRRAIRVVLLACLVVGVARFGPDWVSFPAHPPAGGLEVGVTSWNLELGEPDATVVRDTIAAAPVGVVALEELTPGHAGLIAADVRIQARFPYQVLLASNGSTGIGLLSSYPILERDTVRDDPPIIHARLDAGAGRTFDVVVAHPLNGKVSTLGDLPVPIGFDPAIRDAQIATLRGVVDALLAAGDRVVLVGDFNVTDREPAYHDLSAGLVDVQAEVGFGPPPTWRPDAMKWLPFGILRIDMAFTGNGVAPVSSAPDCTPRGSDHCILRATVSVP